MTPGLLLDTHTQLWLEQGLLGPEALDSISDAGPAGQLYVSVMTSWELGVAAGKKDVRRRPNLQGVPPSLWIRWFCERFYAQPLIISSDVAAEAASVASTLGHGDPGDCFLIATARVHGLTLVTRDARILEFAAREPDYLSVVAC